MRNISLVPLVLFALLASFDGSAEAESIYNALLFRASQRKTKTKLERSRKYTNEHEDLLMDVVQTYNRRVSVGEQNRVFNRLVKELGMVEMARSAFNDRARVVRRQLGDSKERKSNRIPAIGIAESELLDSLFVKNPKISGEAALQAFELNLSGGSDRPLPSVEHVRNWLKQRKYYVRFSNKVKKSGNVFEESALADQIRCSAEQEAKVEIQETSAEQNSSSFCCDENGEYLLEELDFSLPDSAMLGPEDNMACSEHEKNFPQEVILENLNEWDKVSVVGKACESEKMDRDEEVYRDILDRAKARRGDNTGNAKQARSTKYTCEHAALISDIVKARFNKNLTLTKKYEFFSRIISDIGEDDLCEMRYGTFMKYAGAEKEKLGMRTTVRRNRVTSMGVERRNLLAEIFSSSPHINLRGMMEELRIRGINDFDQDEKKRDAIAHWFKYRTELQRKGCVFESVKRENEHVSRSLQLSPKSIEETAFENIGDLSENITTRN